jgi:hypothetical protein
MRILSITNRKKRKVYLRRKNTYITSLGKPERLGIIWHSLENNIKMNL